MNLYILGGASTVLSLLGIFLGARWVRLFALLTVAAGLIVLALTWGAHASAFGGLYRVDRVSQAITLVALLGVGWSLLLSRSERWEYPLLLLYTAFGIHVIASTTNLVVLLVALELFSLPLYALATWRRDLTGYEAGLKYFLLGALAAAIFLYGIALHFGATGSFDAQAAGTGPLYVASLFLILSALAFKVALVPFQWWTPDVYQGSPTEISLTMATAVKAAGFAALIRVLLPADLGGWGLGLGILIALSVIFGNLGALAQKEAKRLLAYSSIAQAGYIALALYSPQGVPALSFYLIAYLLATGLAFAILSAISDREVPYERLQGLLYRDPLMGLGFAAAMLSLTGIPPLVGFWAKYLVFVQAAQAGEYGLVVLALITSAVSAYYYLRLLGLVVFSSPPEGAPQRLSPLARGTVWLGLILLLLLGIAPGIGYALVG